MNEKYYGIDILYEEHENISKFLKKVRILCEGILEGNEVQTDTFRKVIDFVRNYADRHHHGKEEKILFQVMEAEFGDMAKNLIRHGMLVEHDLGRLYMAQLEEALNQYDKEPTISTKFDILVNTGGYVDLLTRHIAKENDVLFAFAKRSLNEEGLRKVTEQSKAFEEEAKEKHTQAKYLNLLETILG